MTIHTELEQEEIADWLMLYDVGVLETFHEARGGSGNTNYIVQTDQGQFLLRVNEGKSFRDIVYEKDLLKFLAEQKLSVETPTVIPNVIKGHFTPFAENKYASLFGFMPGRALANWEVLPEHCQQIGCFLAELHHSGRAFKGHRRHPYRPGRIFAMLDSLAPCPESLASVILLLKGEQKALAKPLARRVSHSLIHGSLSPDNTRFRHGKLSGVIDFETGSRGPMLYDLAVTLNAWSVDGDGAYHDHLAQALLTGYQKGQPLRESDTKLLYYWARYAALRFTVTWIVHNELPVLRGQQPKRYRDYKHFAQRVTALKDIGQRGFLELCGL